MKYILRPGLVFEHVYGKHLLIADAEARKHCKYLTELDSVSAAIIEAILSEKDLEEMIAKFSVEYMEDARVIQERIEAFLREMEKEQFLVPVKDGDSI